MLKELYGNSALPNEPYVALWSNKSIVNNLNHEQSRVAYSGGNRYMILQGKSELLNKIPSDELKRILENSIRIARFDTSSSTAIQTYPLQTLKKPYKITKSFYNEMMSKLFNLLRREEDEEDFHPPTDYAFKLASELFSNLDELSLASEIPEAALSLNEAGGLRIEWTGNERQMRIIIPESDNSRGYIYYQNFEHYSLEWDTNSNMIAHYINWYLYG